MAECGHPGAPIPWFDRELATREPWGAYYVACKRRTSMAAGMSRWRWVAHVKALYNLILTEVFGIGPAWDWSNRLWWW